MYVQCGYNGCKNCAASPGFSNFVKNQCTHPDYLSLAQGRDRCIKHGHKKPRRNINGCNNKSDVHVLCKKHRSQWHCTSVNCTKPVMRQKMCHYHWRITNSRWTVFNIDLVRNLVMDYLGMNNWEHVHIFSAMCKTWQMSCLPHLSQIGIGWRCRS